MPPSRADAFPLFGTSPAVGQPGVTAPMPPPPGLEGLFTAANQTPPEGTERWFKEVREAAVGRAGEVFEEKAAELWKSAEARLRQLEEQQSRTTSRLEEELQRCQERHESLQREKGQLENSVRALQERMAAAEAALGLGTWNGRSQPPWTPQGPALVRPAAPSAGQEAPSEGEAREAEVGAKAGRRVNSEDAPPSPRAPPGLPPPSPPGSPRAGPADDAARLKLAELVPRSPQPTTTAARLEAAEAGRPEFLSPPPGPMTPRPAATPQRSGTPWRSGGAQQQPPSTPPRTPQTRASRAAAKGTLTPMKSPAAVPSSPFVHCESGGCTFGFMLRVADGAELGLGTELTDDLRALSVTGVKPGGAIDSWNRQCVGGPSAGKAVVVGDKIVAVNGVTEPQGMLQEFQEKRMLGLAVVRGEPDCDIPSQWTAQFAARDRSLSDGGKAKPWGSFLAAWSTPPVGLRSPGGLRAEAFEFVPGGLAAPPPSQPPLAAAPSLWEGSGLE